MSQTERTSSNLLALRRVDATFEREPLREPFGFKGAYVSELWQSAVELESTNGHRVVGLGTQSVLWSDPGVFAAHSEAGGNALMFAVTEWALQRARSLAFKDPLALLDDLLPDTLDVAKRMTDRPKLRTTFALNALVPIDLAAWLLYAQALEVSDVDAMLPGPYRSALPYRHREVACVPVIGYGMTVDAIEHLARQGFFCLKVKLGHPGSQDEMLEQDKRRLADVHRVLGPLRTPYTESGYLPYYFDANGRYAHPDTLRRLLDFADTIGALDHIAILEEPFPESVCADVGDLGVRLAADESAHTDLDALARIDQGYAALALKPVAKTLSMTLKIARVAHTRGIPCFCADLTVNPILVEWNRMLAARLPPFPGLHVGLLEANGRQLYRNWDRLASYHPVADAPWTEVRDGVFHLDEEYYARSGGLFAPSRHYNDLFRHP